VAAVRLTRNEFAPVERDEEGNLFLDVPDPIPVVPRPDDLRRTIQDGDTVFSLAWLAYRTTLNVEQDIRPTGFYDVIAQVNGVVDVTEPLPTGKVFRIPSVQALTGAIRVRQSIRTASLEV